MSKIAELKTQCESVSEILKAVSHPQRLLILCSLLDGKKNVSELLEEIDISQSQLSQFLKRLTLEGILVNEKEGNFSYYLIKEPKIKKLIRSLHQIFKSA